MNIFHFRYQRGRGVFLLGQDSTSPHSSVLPILAIFTLHFVIATTPATLNHYDTRIEAIFTTRYTTTNSCLYDMKLLDNVCCNQQDFAPYSRGVLVSWHPT